MFVSSSACEKLLTLRTVSDRRIRLSVRAWFSVDCYPSELDGL